MFGSIFPRSPEGHVWQEDWVWGMCVHVHVCMGVKGCICTYVSVSMLKHPHPAFRRVLKTLRSRRRGGQLSTGLGAQASGKLPNLSADHNRKAKCFL